MAPKKGLFLCLDGRWLADEWVESARLMVGCEMVKKVIFLLLGIQMGIQNTEKRMLLKGV